MTTPEGTVLEGITRRTVEELCDELGIGFDYGTVPADSLREADEAFLSSTAGGVIPVTRVDDPDPLQRRAGAGDHADPAISTGASTTRAGTPPRWTTDRPGRPGRRSGARSAGSGNGAEKDAREGRAGHRMDATMGRLEGQVAVVTGGGNGIGRETVLRFLREGARVVVADLNPETGARTVELAAAGGWGDDVRFARTDVTDEAAVRAAIECACDEFGRLDCVFKQRRHRGRVRSGDGHRGRRVGLLDGGARARRVSRPQARGAGAQAAGRGRGAALDRVGGGARRRGGLALLLRGQGGGRQPHPLRRPRDGAAPGAGQRHPRPA